MKLLPIALVLILATTAFAQAPAPATRLATNPTLNPPASTPSAASFPRPASVIPLETYIQQIRSCVEISGYVEISPNGSITAHRDIPITASERGFANLLSAIQRASTRGVPLDVIENVGDVREPFLKNAQATRLKLVESRKESGIDDIPGKIAAFNQQKSAAQLQLEVKQAKEKSIQDRIKKMTLDVDDLVIHDTILSALGKLQTIRQQQLKRVQAMIDASIAPHDNLETAEAELAAATVAVAKRRAEIAATAFGGAFDTLNKLLLEVSLDIDELQITIKAIDGRVKQLKDLQNTDAKINTLVGQIASITDLNAAESSLVAATQPQP